ncbi:hypothetical protein [Pseudalkalibacillus sp. JSM 102089]|uniref:hypothetical protein n=1 Tax=Pseudalkalibacillus sp. JSM 102089 TaxID=3229856 RepID=UPI0035239E1F
MKKAMIVLLLLGSVFSVFYFFAIENNNDMPVGARSTPSTDLELMDVTKKIKETNFTSKVVNELENQGYQAEGKIHYSIYDAKKKDLIFVISNSEYKGEKTEQEINAIIDKLSKSSELGSFNVIFQKEEKAVD